MVFSFIQGNVLISRNVKKQLPGNQQTLKIPLK
jgi:hypothetical protein